MGNNDSRRIMVRLVESFDPEMCPRGKLTRLRVELVQDGLGRPMAVPVMVARGERDGPVFGLTAALHGNELNGIPVIHRLLNRLDRRTLRGTVVGVVVVNVPSYLEHRRRFREGVDLNHIMPGRPDGSVPEIYAHRFMDRVVRRFDYLADLHTASPGRVNSLYVRADMTKETTAQMAYLQRPQIIVHNPASDHTLRGAAEALDIPAITVEIGNPGVFQNELIKRSVTGLRAVLAEVGMIPRRRQLAMGDPPVLCSSSYWLYSDAGGILEVFPRVTQHVACGETVARVINVYGDLMHEYPSPEDGVVIGKSINPVGQTGARILHLGILADDSATFHKRRDTAPQPQEEQS